MIVTGSETTWFRIVFYFVIGNTLRITIVNFCLDRAYYLSSETIYIKFF